MENAGSESTSSMEFEYIIRFHIISVFLDKSVQFCPGVLHLKEKVFVKQTNKDWTYLRLFFSFCDGDGSFQIIILGNLIIFKSIFNVLLAVRESNVLSW